MDCVVVTNGSRPTLLKQTLRSLRENATRAESHRVVVSWDNGNGACEARNRGTTLFKQRQEFMMLADDDVYFVPGWDVTLVNALGAMNGLVVSGHAHPFNHGLGVYKAGGAEFEAAGVLSTVHLAMPWSIWDDAGMLHGRGGPGGSEDVEWCKRVVDLGFGLAVTRPMCVIHCGFTNSVGGALVGEEHMRKMNDELIELNGLQGKVIIE